jgi:predicted ferric reductase
MSELPNAAPADSLPETPALPLRTVLLAGLGITIGVLAATIALPTWLPGLSESLLGTQPKVYWYLSRASGLVAFTLIWLSMVWGLLVTGRLARQWPGAAIATDLHQHVSLLGLGFALFHGLILLGDRYANYSLAQIVIPFTTSNYRPLWVGIGQLGFYVAALVSLTFYVRRSIGTRTWRAIHYLSFVTYAMALMHGVMAGSETSVTWVRGFYWSSAAVLVFLTIYRILATRFPPVRSKAARLQRAD